MDLKQLIDLQKEFDSSHKGRFEWDQKVDEENMEMLEFLLLCLIGEIGETANLVKKVIRGDFELIKIKPELSEEIADLFIYILKLSYQLDFDLEKQVLLKMEKNKKRFQRYQKDEVKS